MVHKWTKSNKEITLRFAVIAPFFLKFFAFEVKNLKKRGGAICDTTNTAPPFISRPIFPVKHQGSGQEMRQTMRQLDSVQWHITPRSVR